MQSNRLALEAALARGHLWAAMRNGQYWQLRRNREIKLWKTKLVISETKPLAPEAGIVGKVQAKP
jgi:hypothetical protein